jgi:hypothetical protein
MWACNLQAALQAFLRQLAADGRSPHTIGQYRRHGTAVANWLGTAGIGNDVADLTPDVLARFFASDAAKTSCRGGAKKATQRQRDANFDSVPRGAPAPERIGSHKPRTPATPRTLRAATATRTAP